MRSIQTLTFALTACIGFSPMVTAILGTSCIGALDAAADVPGTLIEHIRRESCKAGCEPKLEHWDKLVKGLLVEPLAEDAANYVGVPEAKQSVAIVLSDVYQRVSDNCRDKLEEGSHLCADPDSLKPFIDCAHSAAYRNAFRHVVTLLPYESEQNCKKLVEYMRGPALWEKDFPEHFAGYVEKCHDL